MKKAVLLTVSLLFLVGCSAQRTSNADKLQRARISESAKVESSKEKKKDSVKIASKTLYYHQLQKSDRNKILFAFQAFSDSSKAESGQVANDTAPLPFSVDMQVTNNSTKTLKLDESKIVWLALGQNVDPTMSDKSKTLTIKPGKTQNVVELFSDFNNQNFVDAGAFCYLNSDYKLAYSYLAYEDGGVTSKNLTDKKLIEMNTPATTTNEESQTSTESSTDSSAIGENYSSTIKVTPASQFSSFTIANTSDTPIIISPNSLLLRINSQADFYPVPQSIIDAGDVTIQPGQSHVYPYLFGYDGMAASSLSISLDTGGNTIWSWDSQNNE